MSEYGYARVSSRDQKEERQVIALVNAGVLPQQIFVDKESGKDFNRPKWKSLMRRLRAGDVLFIGSIDRMGRNYGEILEEWRKLTSAKGIDIVVLDMPLLDTRQGEGDLDRRFLADLVLQILSYVAEKERAFIKRRQAEGIAAAKARGVRFGRPPVEVGEELLLSCFREYAAGNIKNMKIAAEMCGFSKITFLRRFHKWRDLSTKENVVR